MRCPRRRPASPRCKGKGAWKSFVSIFPFFFMSRVFRSGDPPTHPNRVKRRISIPEAAVRRGLGDENLKHLLNYLFSHLHHQHSLNSVPSIPYSVFRRSVLSVFSLSPSLPHQMPQMRLLLSIQGKSKYQRCISEFIPHPYWIMEMRISIPFCPEPESSAPLVTWC